MLLGHPLTLRSHPYGKHLHPKLLAKRMKRRNYTKKDTYYVNVINMAIEIG
jgi:hypothetical protein